MKIEPQMLGVLDHLECLPRWQETISRRPIWDSLKTNKDEVEYCTDTEKYRNKPIKEGSGHWHWCKYITCLCFATCGGAFFLVSVMWNWGTHGEI